MRILWIAFALCLASYGCGEQPSAAQSEAIPAAENAAVPPASGPHANIFAAYEGLRAALAADQEQGFADPAEELAMAAEQASAEEGDSAKLNDLAAAARETAGAADLAAARESFSEVSRTLIEFVAANPELAQGRFVYECPMVEGYGKWVQLEEGVSNPYMGEAMLACGVKSDFSSSD